MKKLKLFLAIFISLFLFMPNVFAYEEWPSDISLTLNSSSLSTTNRVFTNAGQLTFNLSSNTVFVPTYDDNQIKYGYISVCQAITHPIDTYSSGIYTKDFKVYETSIPCSMYGTSAYPDSRVIYMTFELNLSNGYMCSTGTSTTYCNLNNDLYIQQVGTNEWTLNSYGFSSEPFIYDSSESTLIDQNSQIIQGQDDINENLGEIQGSIIDDSVNTDGASGFFNNFSTEDNGGISSVITAPLVFVRKITDICEPISLDVLGKDVSLPCGNELFWDKPEVATFRNTWNILFGGAFLFLLLKKVFNVIQNIKDPESDKIEVMDL